MRLHADVEILWIYIDHSVPNPCPKTTPFFQTNRLAKWGAEVSSPQIAIVLCNTLIAATSDATSAYDCEVIKSSNFAPNRGQKHTELLSFKPSGSFFFPRARQQKLSCQLFRCVRSQSECTKGAISRCRFSSRMIYEWSKSQIHQMNKGVKTQPINNWVARRRQIIANQMYIYIYVLQSEYVLEIILLQKSISYIIMINSPWESNKNDI